MIKSLYDYAPFCKMLGPPHHHVSGTAYDSFLMQRLLSTVVYAEKINQSRYIDHARIYKNFDSIAVLSSPYIELDKECMLDLALVKHYANVVGCDVLVYDSMNMYHESTIDIFFISGESFKPIDMTRALLKSTHYNFNTSKFQGRESENRILNRVKQEQDRPLQIPEIRKCMDFLISTPKLDT